jgi:hypothetical protein
LTTFKFTPDQVERANTVAEAALRFEKSVGYPLGVAVVRHHFGDGTAQDVIAELKPFQNADGGFGNGLEVDIASHASNPFAARLAMSVLLSLREAPEDKLVTRLGEWLNSSQADDGDWHFSKEVREDSLAPWFAAWTFPSLNPSCCVTGLGHALGLLSDRTLARTAGLFEEMASPDEARTGEFYNVLPYIEYFSSIEHPGRDQYRDAISENINSSTYEDASHFFDHALGGGPDLVKRIDASVLSTWADRLLAEPAEDGGWPNPYSESWRPFATAGAVMTLAKLRDGV